LVAGIFLLAGRTSEYIDKAKALTGITKDVFTFVNQAQLNKIDKEIEKVQQLPDLFNAKPTGNNTGTAGTPAPDDREDRILQEKIKNLDREAAIRRTAAMQNCKDKKSFEEELPTTERETVQKNRLCIRKALKNMSDIGKNRQNSTSKQAGTKNRPRLSVRKQSKHLLTNITERLPQPASKKNSWNRTNLTDCFPKSCARQNSTCN
jgi:hypothetical protein